MTAPFCLIKCKACNCLFRSPIQFGSAQAFFTSNLMGNSTECPKCKQRTGCDKTNMHFSDREGTIVSGEEALPE